MNLENSAKRRFFRLCCILLLGGLVTTCVEPFETEIESFESILIVDATLTNEQKQQQVLLSRTFRFNEEQLVETGAEVGIVDDQSTRFEFIETEPGKYLTPSEFMAVPGRDYQLIIKTAEGNEYASDFRSLTPVLEIDDLYAERTVNGQGVLGITVFADSSDPQGNAKFYRYEYDETYKIIAPRWSPVEIEVLSKNPPEIQFVTKTEETRVCYGSTSSTDIILASSTEFDEDKVTRFPIRFLSKENFLTQSRYSILVRQFVQSPEAFAFYETLKEFSDFESLFSQTQPGFIAGNVFSRTNTNEKVIGFFDVSSVSSKRIFFEHIDFFPEGPPPPFINACETFSPLFVFMGFSPLIDALETGFFTYFNVNDDPEPFEGPYLLVPKECGDCRVLGSNKVPDFWEE